jgi:hypothetical protein
VKLIKYLKGGAQAIKVWEPLVYTFKAVRKDHNRTAPRGRLLLLPYVILYVSFN